MNTLTPSWICQNTWPQSLEASWRRSNGEFSRSEEWPGCTFIAGVTVRSHFHVWMLPRPLGMLEAKGMMLPIWEDVLPNFTDEELREAAQKVALALVDE